MSALRAVVAARISQLTDESVSIQRQVKSGEAYALARLWTVVGYVRDEDVSAAEVAPFDRPGFKEWLAPCRSRPPGRAVAMAEVPQARSLLRP